MNHAQIRPTPSELRHNSRGYIILASICLFFALADILTIIGNPTVSAETGGKIVLAGILVAMAIMLLRNLRQLRRSANG